MINGPPPTQGGSQFGENQVPPFNEQESSGQPGGPPSNQLPSLLQVYTFKYTIFMIFIDGLFCIRLNKNITFFCFITLDATRNATK